jgi:hypothetical protein
VPTRPIGKSSETSRNPGTPLVWERRRRKRNVASRRSRRRFKLTGYVSEYRAASHFALERSEGEVGLPDASQLVVDHAHEALKRLRARDYSSIYKESRRAGYARARAFLDIFLDRCSVFLTGKTLIKSLQV